MIYPTAEQISKLASDRYLVTVATAKCARMVTDEYVEQRSAAERLIARKETDKPLFSLIDPEIRDDKAVKTAIYRLMSGEYKILMNGEVYGGEQTLLRESVPEEKAAQAENAGDPEPETAEPEETDEENA